LLAPYRRFLRTTAEAAAPAITPATAPIQATRVEASSRACSWDTWEAYVSFSLASDSLSSAAWALSAWFSAESWASWAVRVALAVWSASSWDWHVPSCDR